MLVPLALAKAKTDAEEKVGTILQSVPSTKYEVGSRGTTVWYRVLFGGSYCLGGSPRLHTCIHYELPTCIESRIARIMWDYVLIYMSGRSSPATVEVQAIT